MTARALWYQFRPYLWAMAATTALGLALTAGWLAGAQAPPPPITEQTKQGIEAALLSAFADQGFVTDPAPPPESLLYSAHDIFHAALSAAAPTSDPAPRVRLVSLRLTPSRTIAGGVCAEWTLHYTLSTTKRTISGGADLPLMRDGLPSPYIMSYSLGLAAQFVRAQYCARDLRAALQQRASAAQSGREGPE